MTVFLSKIFKHQIYWLRSKSDLGCGHLFLGVAHIIIGENGTLGGRAVW